MVGDILKEREWDLLADQKDDMGLPSQHPSSYTLLMSYNVIYHGISLAYASSGYCNKPEEEANGLSHYLVLPFSFAEESVEAFHRNKHSAFLPHR